MGGVGRWAASVAARPVPRPERPEAVGRGIRGAAPTPRLVSRGVSGDRCADRGDGPGRFAGGGPQQSAADLLHPASPPRSRLPEPTPVLPEPPGAGAERATGAAGEDARGSPTGQSHPHWLELLGFTRFVRPARFACLPRGASEGLARPGTGTVRSVTTSRPNCYPGKAILEPGPNRRFKMDVKPLVLRA